MAGYALPENAAALTESTSIAIAQQIQFHPILTPLADEAITSSFVQAGTGGPPILLLHGFDSSLLEYRRLWPHLSQHHQTWAVDLLGFGFTERCPGLPYGPAAIQSHLFAFLEHHIKTPVILVGASMGGAAALDFALTYPDLVERLILIDSAGLAGRPMAGKLMIPPLDRWATDFLRSPKVREGISRKAYYDSRWVTADATLCASLHVEQPGWRESLIAFTKSGGYGSFQGQLPQLPQPTLILWGQQDRILGTKDAPRFERLIPNSQLVWIPEAGHVPHLEQAEKVAEVMLDFIRQGKPIISTVS
ncbi:MAG: alpha/beta hydrolase [Spirulina sp. DLM2.Bin59]|nr:MAG: alpha/beta hydrolase [Spirulina sp. DLM2.Bin59]